MHTINLHRASPSEWRIVAHQINTPRGTRQSYLVTSPYGPICAMTARGDTSRDAAMIRANANLIAAAPDMARLLATILRLTDPGPVSATEFDAWLSLVRTQLTITPTP